MIHICVDSAYKESNGLSPSPVLLMESIIHALYTHSKTAHPASITLHAGV